MGLKSMAGNAQPITAAERQSRLAKVQGLMQQQKIAALLIEAGSTCEYFTGIHWWTSERVTAAIPTGTSEAGAKVPAHALVFGESEAWVYLQTAANTFLRIKVDISRPLDDGYFVTTVKPGDKVVVDGAGLLMAREVNPSTEPEE